MALVSIILSLLIDRYLGSLREFRSYRWFDDFTDRFRELIPELGRHPLAFVVLLLALAALATLVVAGLLDGIWVVFGFAFGLAVLLYSYGCQDLEPQVEAFIDARLREDAEAARYHLAAMLHGEMPGDPRLLTRTVVETVLVELNDRLLAVIFWFVLLGPVGALTFRLSSLLKKRFLDESTGFGAAAARVYHILSWVPARLTAFSYALAGSFEESVRYRHEEAHRWQDENRGVLVASGLGALQQPPVPEETVPSREREIAELRGTIALVRRATLLWIAVIGIALLVSAIVTLQLEASL